MLVEPTSRLMPDCRRDRTRQRASRAAASRGCVGVARRPTSPASASSRRGPARVSRSGSSTRRGRSGTGSCASLVSSSEACARTSSATRRAWSSSRTIRSRSPSRPISCRAAQTTIHASRRGQRRGSSREYGQHPWSRTTGSWPPWRRRTRPRCLLRLRRGVDEQRAVAESGAPAGDGSCSRGGRARGTVAARRGSPRPRDRAGSPRTARSSARCTATPRCSSAACAPCCCSPCTRSRWPASRTTPATAATRGAGCSGPATSSR